MIALVGVGCAMVVLIILMLWSLVGKVTTRIRTIREGELYPARLGYRATFGGHGWVIRRVKAATTGGHGWVIRRVKAATTGGQPKEQ